MRGPRGGHEITLTGVDLTSDNILSIKQRIKDADESLSIVQSLRQLKLFMATEELKDGNRTLASYVSESNGEGSGSRGEESEAVDIHLDMIVSALPTMGPSKILSDEQRVQLLEWLVESRKERGGKEVKSVKLIVRGSEVQYHTLKLYLSVSCVCASVLVSRRFFFLL